MYIVGKRGYIVSEINLLADIIKDLEKYYDLKIQMDKKEIAKVALTGKFRISDGLDYALRVLQNDVAFIYQRNRDNDVIHIK